MRLNAIAWAAPLCSLLSGAPRLALPPEMCDGGDGDGDAAPSNPFYAAYGGDELADLWSVHTQYFGEAASAEEEPEEVTERSILGGLHEAVLSTIAEGEADNDGSPPTSEPPPPLSSPETR
jgi:hypothetical protein